MNKSSLVLVLLVGLVYARPEEKLDTPAPSDKSTDLETEVEEAQQKAAETGQECSVLEQKGRCVPFYQCQILDQPTPPLGAAPQAELDYAIQRFFACKHPVEVCCHENGIYKTDKS